MSSMEAIEDCIAWSAMIGQGTGEDADITLARAKALWRGAGEWIRERNVQNQKEESEMIAMFSASFAKKKRE